MITLDFETEAIDEHGRPPKPVGLAIRWADGKQQYLAWGHPTENNCVIEEAWHVIRGIIERSEDLLLFHNAKFDLGVIAEMYRAAGLNLFDTLEFKRVHDTLFQLFLLDPHEKSISLKPSAARHLGIEPEEQKELHDWIIQHVGCPPKEAGAHISKAPANLVGKYAIGDVYRTYLLHQCLIKKVEEQGMMRAYDLERAMLPFLLQAELRGIRVDLKMVEEYAERYTAGLKRVEFQIYKRLGKFIELGSSQQLGKALVRGGHVSNLLMTSGGQSGIQKPSTSKDSIAQAQWADPALKTLIAYWKSVSHALSHSWNPWMDHAVDGRLISQFNQVRGDDSGLFGDEDEGGGKGLGGARTGRLSVAWFLNIANAKQKIDYSLLPPGTPIFVSPKVALLPEEGQVWIDRDWKQQEFRIMAHFEYGPLFQRYQEDPNLEIHQETTDAVNSSGLAHKVYERNEIKTVNLALLYKLGVDKFALKMGLDRDSALKLRKMVQNANPGIAQLESAIADLIQDRGYVLTYYGARILKEPSRLIQGRLVNFIYKVANHLIQRSAAEQMKEAVVKWHTEGYANEWPWLLSVHDANGISADEKDVQEASISLDHVMRSGTFEVKMLSDMKYGPSWGTVKKPCKYTHAGECSEGCAAINGAYDEA